MIKSIISWMLNTLHLVFIFIPIILLLTPKRLLQKYSLLVKVLALFIFLTPLHWRFLDNRCFLSVLSIKMGNTRYRKNTEAPFTRENLGPLYKPFMKVFGLKWESEEDLDLTLSFHWVLNFIATWYVIAIKLC